MKIRSIIERPDGIEVGHQKFAGSLITMGTKRYYFRPTEESNGLHVCDVEDPEHAARLLLIPEAFEALDDVPPEVTKTLIRDNKSLQPKRDNVREVDPNEHDAIVNEMRLAAEERRKRQQEAAKSQEPDIASVELADLDVAHMTVKQVNDWFAFALQTDATNPEAVRAVAKRFGLELPTNVQPQRLARDTLAAMQTAGAKADADIASELAGDPGDDDDDLPAETPLDNVGEADIEVLFAETFPDAEYDRSVMRAMAKDLGVKVDGRRPAVEIARAILAAQLSGEADAAA